MKKLLSLLSVLTISGIAEPTTIAASLHQKEEKLNSNINYKQINNLKREKRQSNNQSIIGISEIVITTNSGVYSSRVALNNKVYFGSGEKVYEYNPATGEQKVVIKTNGSVVSSGVALNNKIYFGSLDNKIYEYNFETRQQKIIIATNGSFVSSGVALNNKIYFCS